MPLRSKHFKDDARLQACLVNHPAHVAEGASGEHVARIQFALLSLDGGSIDAVELKNKRYGKSTAAAVLAYKKRRAIINRSYQSTADNIVGKMTIALLDEEMLKRERKTNIRIESMICDFDVGKRHGEPA